MKEILTKSESGYFIDNLMDEFIYNSKFVGKLIIVLTTDKFRCTCVHANEEKGLT